MSTTKTIQSALISVYSKEGLAPVVQELQRLGVSIYSTGGTQRFIEEQGIPVHSVESLTGYPSILDGRVKTLHPKVFGGILARGEQKHQKQLEEYQIPPFDLVIVDLYPFEETLASTDDESTIIEKIDIGGIALIRAAAKNAQEVLIVPSVHQYTNLLQILKDQNGQTSLEDRRRMAAAAFQVSSHYDTAIFQYFNRETGATVFKQSIPQSRELRYGENPHQQAHYFGKLEEMLEQIQGKALSYNNLVDIDAAVQLMAEFKDEEPAFAVLKHTNPCGLALRPTQLEAWKAALAGDPVSAFGGILITNRPLDVDTAREIHSLFYEVLIAPGYEPEALEVLQQKKKRILLKIKRFEVADQSFKRLLNGVIQQDTDLRQVKASELKVVTKAQPSQAEISDLLFANTCVKHLKSNAIALVKNRQLVGIGCGQTSRVDALRQAIEKAQRFEFDLQGAVMASDAFFPFPDCVEIADQAGIKAVIQPGGSIRDQDSVDYCDAHEMGMVTTGVRHFRH